MTSFRTAPSTSEETRKLPWWGVAMKTTRFTYGWCSKNIERWISARVSGLTSILSKGTSERASQKRVPLSVTMSRVSSPPWLWPITTSWSSAGSRPSGSSSVRMRWSLCRRSLAESRTGLLVL